LEEGEVDAEAKAENADARGRIAGLDEKATRHSHVIAMLRCWDIAILQDKVTQLSTDSGHLIGEVSAFRSVASGIEILSEDIPRLKSVARKMHRSRATDRGRMIRLLNSSQRISSNFGKYFWLRSHEL
jgi:hypothetical protein